MNERHLHKLTIRGFKSIRELVGFEMRNLNVIVGANGTGKSNLISFFKMLRALMNNNLNRYIFAQGGADSVLFGGRKQTGAVHFEAAFGDCAYRSDLVSGAGDGLGIQNEEFVCEGAVDGWHAAADAQTSAISGLADAVEQRRAGADRYRAIYEAIKSWQILHVDDSGPQAAMRHSEIVQDRKYLRDNASNIAPYLLRLREEHDRQYQKIRHAVNLVIPLFDDFILEPETIGPARKVRLGWKHRGSDYPMKPHQLSDGSIRFICLAAALLQPQPPAAIIIDEPELGLHCSAMEILAELIQAAAAHTQVIVATQSPLLLDHFAVDDLVVVRRRDGASVFERLDERDFNVWLEDCTIGELWVRNIIDAGPVYE